MGTTPKLIVIGAGPGGLAAAMQLAYAGCDVTVVEKQAYVGGRTSLLSLGAYRFDRGPTFLNMPHRLEQTFAQAGRVVHDYMTLLPLDPMYRLHFSDVQLNMSADRHKMHTEIERVFPGEGGGYDAFMHKEKRHFEAIAPLLLERHDSLWHYLHPRFLRALPHMHVSRSLMDRLATYFTDPRLQLAFTFQAKYLGMSPWECPAAFSMLAYMEHAYGVHHPLGGLHQIPLMMQRVLEEHGGRVRTDAPVRSILVRDRRVTGVCLESGEQIEADGVIVNADFGYAAHTLFPPGTLRTYAPNRWNTKKLSCSTMMLYLGVRKSFAHLPHHTIIFSPDYRKNVAQITESLTLPDQPSLYVHNASRTDDRLAPPGHSALYVLAPVPNNRSQLPWEQYKETFREHMLATIRRAGFDFTAEDIVVSSTITPTDWETNHNVYAGATFSLGHQLSQMLYFRPHNRLREVKGCWLVGGGTHPGSGLPTILASADITARDVLAQWHGSHGWRWA